MFPILIAAVAAVLVQFPLFAAYAIVPALLAGTSPGDLASGAVFFSYWILVVAGVFAVVVGIPAFLLMQRLNLLRVTHFSALGFGVAVLPAVIVFWPMSLDGRSSSGMTYHGTYRDMVVDGMPTVWGWLSFAETVLTFGVHGMLGAVTFLLAWRRYSRRAAAI